MGAEIFPWGPLGGMTDRRDESGILFYLSYTRIESNDSRSRVKIYGAMTNRASHSSDARVWEAADQRDQQEGEQGDHHLQLEIAQIGHHGGLSVHHAVEEGGTHAGVRA